jgi:hypothetical protein
MSSLSADIEKYQQKAATWGAIAGIGGNLFQMGGGFDGIKAAFTRAPTPQVNEQPRTSHAARIGL